MHPKISSAKWRPFCPDGDELSTEPSAGTVVTREVCRYTCYTWRAPLRWRHNDHAGVSNHQPHGCLLNRLFRRRWKKTSKLCVTGLCAGNSPGPVNSLHKGPVTRKMFPFDDVILTNKFLWNPRFRGWEVHSPEHRKQWSHYIHCRPFQNKVHEILIFCIVNPGTVSWLPRSLVRFARSLHWRLMLLKVRKAHRVKSFLSSRVIFCRK